MEVVKENMTVVLQRGKVLKAEKLQVGKKIVFEKMHFVPDNAFGKPFNSWFRVSSNRLEKVEDETVVVDAPELAEKGNVDAECDMETPKESVEDNRSLDDTHGKSQSLKREEIVNMKTSGAKGEDIVNEIIKNSSSFASKTTYSQKKYLKKKHKKHMTNICILKPTARLLCKMYESREPGKISHMRLNTLSQILTMANVHHGSKIAVVETCSGLLLSLLMERLGGDGSIVNLHTGETPTNFHAIRHMNYSEDFWSTLHSLPICKMGPLLAGKTFVEAVGEMPEEDSEKISESKPSRNVGSETAEDPGEKKKGKKTELTEEEKCQIRMERKRKRLSHQRSAWDTLKSKNMDAVILACRFHPTPILLTLLEFLAPSRPFVVHCENQEPLMELFVQLTSSGKAVNLNISEAFTRQYQVLPDQTHPLVMMSTCGGYLLTGTKVKTQSERSNLTKDEGESKAKKTKVE